MRTESFRREFRRIRETFHPHTAEERATREGWRPLRTPRKPGPHRRVSDIMEARPLTVRPESPLGPVVALMIEKHIGGVPVVDAEGRIVGALDETDLLKIFYEPEATDVASVMTRDPVAISAGASLLDVADQLMATGFRRVLVHSDGRLVGIVTRAHLMPSILESLEAQLRARPEAWSSTPGGATHH